MTELATAFEIARNFPSGIGGFFGSIIGGLITAFYLRNMLINYLERTVKNEQDIKEIKNELIIMKARVGIK